MIFNRFGMSIIKISLKEKYIPYLIVRSFQKGYPLKINQQIKFAKTEFKIIDI